MIKMPNKLLNYFNLKKLYKKRKKRNEYLQNQENLLNLTNSLKKFIEEYNEDEKKRKNNIKTVHPDYHVYHAEMKTLSNMPTVMPAFANVNGVMPPFNEYFSNDTTITDPNKLIDINLNVLNDRIIKLNHLLEKIYESQIMKCKCNDEEYLNMVLQHRKRQRGCCRRCCSACCSACCNACCSCCSSCCRSSCSDEPPRPYMPSKSSLPQESYYSQATMPSNIPSNIPSTISQHRNVNFGNITFMDEIPLRNPAFNLTQCILTHTLNGVKCVLSKLKQVNDLYANNPSFVDLPNNYPCNIDLNGTDCTNIRGILLDCLKKIDNTCNQNTEYSLTQENKTTNILMDKINEIQTMTEECLTKLNSTPEQIKPKTESQTFLLNKPNQNRTYSSYSLHNTATNNEIRRTDSFYDKLAKSIIANKQNSYLSGIRHYSPQYSNQYSTNTNDQSHNSTQNSYKNSNQNSNQNSYQNSNQSSYKTSNQNSNQNPNQNPNQNSYHISNQSSNKSSNQPSIVNKTPEYSTENSYNGSRKNYSYTSPDKNSNKIPWYLNSLNDTLNGQYSSDSGSYSYTHSDNKSRTYSPPNPSKVSSNQYSNDTSPQNSHNSDYSRSTNKTAKRIPSTIIRYGEKSAILTNDDELNLMTPITSKHTYVSQPCSSHSLAPSLLPNFLLKRKCSNCACPKRQNYYYRQNITKSKVALSSLFENLDSNYNINTSPNILHSIMRYPNLNYGHTFSNFNFVEQYKDEKQKF